MRNAYEDRGVAAGPRVPATRRRLGRFGVLAVLAIVFAGAASVFGPFASRAGPGDGSAMPQMLGKDGRILIGRTLGREHRLTVYATRDGTLYTVTASDGRILARDLAADDVYRMFPDLDPGSLHASPGEVSGRLMMVDPDR
jgi:hypothetical protein